MWRSLILVVLVLPLLLGCSGAHEGRSLLNVSYDPTREFYRQLNGSFETHWRDMTGEEVKVYMSHGGSGKQARAVADGLQADIVTLATPGDIDLLAERAGLVPKDWRARQPGGRPPYTSTIVLLVRSGNPKQVRDWGDLARPGVVVVCANPKTSGGARWSYLAAWVWADAAFKGDEAEVRAFMAALYGNAPVLDAGARGAMTTFAQRQIGDVLITWESEALLALDEFGRDKLETVYPSISIEAEPPAAIVDKNARRHGVLDLAQAYLDYLYSPEGQRLAAEHHFRPTRPENVPAALLEQFQPVKIVRLEDGFGDWERAQKTHFSAGGVFDQIFQAAR